MSIDRPISTAARRTAALAIALLLALTALASPATADPFGEPHPHVLILHAEVVDEPWEGTPFPYTVVDYGHCVELAGGETLRRNNHHDHLHFGPAGQALRKAGHWIMPFVSCDQLAAMVGED